MQRELAIARRIDQLLVSASRAELEDLGQRMGALAHQRGLWLERQGRKQGLPFALCPWVLSREEQHRLHALGWQLRMALSLSCRLASQQRAIQQLLPLEPRELAWLERYRAPELERRPPERIFCRLDALLERGDDAELRVHWLEPNVVGSAGLSYSAAIEAATCEVLLPWLRERERGPALALERNDDGRRLLFDELCQHAAQLGISGRLPNVALVDDLSQYTFGGELGRLRDFLATCGVRAALIAPDELDAVSADRLIADRLEIDIVFRFIELGELIALEERGKDLSGLRRAFAQGRVVPSVAGELEHKSVFEILSRGDLLAYFPRARRAALAGSIPWTRLLRERRTDDPDGRPCELAAFSERARERLVLKPNRGYGGHGVVIGPAVDQRTWSRALDAALANPDSYVVQRYATVDRQELTVSGDAGIERGLHHRSAAVFPGRDAMCLFGRFSRGPVVNITQGGGVVAFMTER